MMTLLCGLAVLSGLSLLACFGADTPPVPQATDVGAQNLLAQAQALTGTGSFAGVGSIPDLTRQYGPEMTQLQLQGLSQLLQGFPAGPQTQTRNQTASQTGWYDAQGNYLGAGSGAGDAGNWWTGRPPSGPGAPPAPGAIWRSAGTPYSTTATTEQAATPGLLSLYSDVLQPAINQLNTSQRTANVGDVQTLGPAARTAIRNANPDTAGLLDQLNQQATQQMQLGTRLSPEQLAEVRNSTQGMSAVRGWGYSPGDLARVGVETTDTGNQMQQVRNQFGQSVARQNQGFYGDPFTTVLAGSTGAQGVSALGGQAYGQYSQAGTSPFVNLSGPQAELSNTGQQIAGKVNMQSAQLNADLYNQLIGGGMSVLGGLI